MLINIELPGNEIYLPMSIEPATSKKVAKQQAWKMVSTLEPTLVPKELATSLAPIPNARTKAITNPNTMSHSKAGEYGSNIVPNYEFESCKKIKESIFLQKFSVDGTRCYSLYTTILDEDDLKNVFISYIIMIWM